MVAYMEDIIETTGGCGRFQIIVCLGVNFAKGILCFSVIFMMFGGLEPDWWCLDDIDAQNTSLVVNRYKDHDSLFKSCYVGNGTKACQRFVFDSSVRTIVSEWNLVCDSSWIRSTITSIQMAGLFLGNALGGHSADAIGRKPTFLGAIIVNSMLNATIIFVPSWILFAVFRFFIGVACGFQLTVMYSLQCEFLPTNWRSFVVAVPGWSLMKIIFALLCWLLQDWRYIHIAFTVFGAVSLISCCVIQESFRWHLAHNQVDKALKIIEFVKKFNRRSSTSTQEMEELAVKIQETEKAEGDRKYSLVDLVRSKTLLKHTVCLGVIWFSVGLSVYGLQFGLSAIAGSFYANVAIFSAVQTPLAFILHLLQNSIGRRKTFALFLSIFTLSMAIATISYIFEVSEARNMISRICSLVALSIIDIAFSTMQTITIEIYPTVIRNIGYGMQNTMTRVGAVVSPQLAFLESMFPGIMYIVCTFIGILSIIMLKFLPETRGLNLQDRIHEVRSGIGATGNAKQEVLECQTEMLHSENQNNKEDIHVL